MIHYYQFEADMKKEMDNILLLINQYTKEKPFALVYSFHT